MNLVCKWVFFDKPKTGIWGNTKHFLHKELNISCVFLAGRPICPLAGCHATCCQGKIFSWLLLREWSQVHPGLPCHAASICPTDQPWVSGYPTWGLHVSTLLPPHQEQGETSLATLGANQKSFLSCTSTHLLAYTVPYVKLYAVFIHYKWCVVLTSYSWKLWKLITVYLVGLCHMCCSLLHVVG